MSNGTMSPGRARISARTLRTDRWWQPAVLTVVGLVAWLTYATVRVFMQRDYYVAAYHYLTPFYSPCVSQGCTFEMYSAHSPRLASR